VSELAWAELPTPVGRLSVGCSAAGVASVRWSRRRPEQDTPTAADNACAQARDAAIEARRQLAEYLRGDRRDFDLPLDWAKITGQQRQVLSVLYHDVGYGDTVTYGALAGRAGLEPSGNDLPARTVGQIMGGNPIAVIVPCHRVVASDGLGGYSGGTGVEVKRWLLILEGALPPTLDWEPATARPECQRS
jgi:methylated-DNA-[protein]-cysteine S-methyltransferase